MSKVKAKISGLDGITEKFKTFVKNAIKDEETLITTGKLIVDQIKKRTRGRQDTYKEPKLKKSTIERRKALIKQGNSSEFSEPAQSNLTLSGQLLNALRFEINASKSLVTISLSDKRTPYKGAKGQDLENKTNSEVKRDLEARGFRFLFISDKLKSRLQDELKAQIRRQLTNYAKIKRSLK